MLLFPLTSNVLLFPPTSNVLLFPLASNVLLFPPTSNVLLPVVRVSRTCCSSVSDLEHVIPFQCKIPTPPQVEFDSVYYIANVFLRT